MELVAFVFMPEHVHLLVYPSGEAANHYPSRDISTSRSCINANL